MGRSSTMVRRSSTRPVSDRRQSSDPFSMEGPAEAKTCHGGEAMINPLIAYQLAKEHQRELTDQAQQRVLVHLANDADGGCLAAVARHAVAPGVAALRRSPR